MNILEAQHTWSLTRCHEFQQQRFLLFTKFSNYIPECLDVILVDIASIVSMLPPILDIDRPCPRYQVVQFCVVEHLQPFLFDHASQSLPYESSLLLEGVVHLVVYEQVEVLHFVLAVQGRKYSVTFTRWPCGTRFMYFLLMLSWQRKVSCRSSTPSYMPIMQTTLLQRS